MASAIRNISRNPPVDLMLSVPQMFRLQPASSAPQVRPITMFLTGTVLVRKIDYGKGNDAPPNGDDHRFLV